mgnify:CR=1 FL=1
MLLGVDLTTKSFEQEFYLINEDEKISSEIEKLNVTGSKIIKNTIIVPIDNTLIYVVPIYQVMLNEANQVPTLRKVVVACENKIAIGENLEKAFNNLSDTDKELINALDLETT